MDTSGKMPAGVSISSPPSVSTRLHQFVSGRLVVILHAMEQALQPTHRFVSMTIP